LPSFRRLVLVGDTKGGAQRLFAACCLFPNYVCDLLKYICYELGVTKSPVFLSQAEERHLKKLLHWLVLRSSFVFVFLSATALVITDIAWSWSVTLGKALGIDVLWAINERFLQVLLPLLGVVIPLLILAVSVTREELGPQFTDLMIMNVSFFQLLLCGILLVVGLAVLLPQAAKLRTTEKTILFLSSEPILAHPVYRLGAWALIVFAVFMILFLLWLNKVGGLLLSWRRFALVSNVVIGAYARGQARMRRRSFRIARLKEACTQLGLGFVPLSTDSTGQPLVKAQRSGLLKDINLDRLSRIAQRLGPQLSSNLIVVVWPDSFVEEGEVLIRIKDNAELPLKELVGLQSCFLISRRRPHARGPSDVDLLELATEQTIRNASDPITLEQWLGLFSHLADLGSVEGLDWVIHRGLSRIVRHTVESRTDESLSTLAFWLYRQVQTMLTKGSCKTARDYLSLLKELFRNSLLVDEKRGIDHSIYYALQVGKDAARYARAAPTEHAFSGALVVLTDVIWSIAEMVKLAFELNRGRLAVELWNDLERLVQYEVKQELYSADPNSYIRRNESLLDKANERLDATYKATGYYLAAAMISDVLNGSINPELGREGFELSLAWAKSPAELFSALEKIDAYKLWKGPEHFRKREIMSPLGETWGGDRGPFIETYILGSIAKASSGAQWPEKPSKLIQELWIPLQASCNRVRTDLARYCELIPGLTENSLENLESIHRGLLELSREKEIEKIKKADIVPSTVAEFARQCVESFNATSAIRFLFQKLAPNRLEICSAKLDSGNTLPVQAPKEVFVRNQLPIVIAPGKPWAEWNDALCLKPFEEGLLVTADIDKAAVQLAKSGFSPELVVTHPKTRNYLRGLPGFQRPSPEEKGLWDRRPGLAGYWLDIPILVSDTVPEGEVWLVNLSEACQLVEYTEAIPEVKVATDDPLKVIIKFPQRLELKLRRPEGASRVRLALIDKGGPPNRWQKFKV